MRGKRRTEGRKNHDSSEAVLEKDLVLHVDSSVKVGTNDLYDAFSSRERIAEGRVVLPVTVVDDRPPRRDIDDRDRDCMRCRKMELPVQLRRERNIREFSTIFIQMKRNRMSFLGENCPLISIVGSPIDQPHSAQPQPRSAPPSPQLAPPPRTHSRPGHLTVDTGRTRDRQSRYLTEEQVLEHSPAPHSGRLGLGDVSSRGKSPRKQQKSLENSRRSSRRKRKRRLRRDRPHEDSQPKHEHKDGDSRRGSKKINRKRTARTEVTSPRFNEDLQKRYRKNVLTRYFGRWHASIMVDVRERKMCLVAALQFKTIRVKKMVILWRKCARRTSVKRRGFRFFGIHMTNSQARCYSTWRYVFSRNRNIVEATLLISSMREANMTTRSFHHWLHLFEVAVKTRRGNALAHIHRKQLVTRRAWIKWVRKKRMVIARVTVDSNHAS
eukprot:720564_1